MLLDEITQKPKVTKFFPDVDFSMTWRQLKNPMIEPYQKDLSFRVAHQVLPTNTYLFSKNISKTKSCHFCTGEETLQHLFLDCPIGNPLLTTSNYY